MLFSNKQPEHGWSKLDRKLAIALQILEDETCPDCGIPVWIGHSDDKDVRFSVHSRICYSCAVVDEAKEKETTRRGKRKPVKGKKRFLANESTKTVTRAEYMKEPAGIIDSES